MKEELQELIREARRELRRASGIPLTAEEKAEEDRTSEIERMNKFLIETLGIKTMFALRPEVTWTERGATAGFTVDDHRFQLYRNGDSYRLSGTGDHELLEMKRSDPNFARRVLVAVGDALAKST